MKIAITENPTVLQVQAIQKQLSAYNLKQVPQLAKLPQDEMVFVWHDASGRTLGGLVAEFDWNWLYIDTIWVTDSERGNGVGTALLQAAESYAARRGVTSAYLLTSSFQAKPFYEKAGYVLVGQNDDRPAGHTTYYLQHDNLTPSKDHPRITCYAPPKPEQIRFLNQSLVQHSYDHVPIIFDPLCIYLRDDNDQIVGGLYGNSYWDWFDLRYVALAEALRGKGYGRRLMNMLEVHLQQQKRRGIVADVADFQSLRFYQKLGFTIVGVLTNRPPRHKSYFVEKRLR